MFANAYRFMIERGECDPYSTRLFAMFDAATACLLEAASAMTWADLTRHYGVLGWPMVNMQADFRHQPASTIGLRFEARSGGSVRRP